MHIVCSLNEYIREAGTAWRSRLRGFGDIANQFETRDHAATALERPNKKLPQRDSRSEER
jgi:hypothetical protein